MLLLFVVDFNVHLYNTSLSFLNLVFNYIPLLGEKNYDGRTFYSTTLLNYDN